jgi:hypothetical protein
MQAPDFPAHKMDSSGYLSTKSWLGKDGASFAGSLGRASRPRPLFYTKGHESDRENEIRVLRTHHSVPRGNTY